MPKDMAMKIGTAIFSYNRSWCTKQSLEALHNCRVIPEKLFLFHDGIKNECDREEWENVENIIREVDWCEKEIITARANKGLAKSIANGVSYMFESCDAVIVLEDDCIVHPQFMEFMIGALEKYTEDNNVFSVSAYCEPVRIEKDEYDAYFTGRISSLGWGTWKERWVKFDFDYCLLKRIKKNEATNEQLNIWGQDLQATIVENVLGRADSWAVFWALKSIEEGGYNIAPYESLVDNIGFDGSGVHSGLTKPEYILQNKDRIIDYKFPPKSFYRDDVIAKMRAFYAYTEELNKERYYRKLLYSMYQYQNSGHSITDCFTKRGVSSIAIWGKGTIADLFLEELQDKIDIRCIVLSSKKHEEQNYNGIPVVEINTFDEDVDAILVIPGYDMETIGDICKSCSVNARLIPVDSLFELVENPI